MISGTVVFILAKVGQLSLLLFLPLLCLFLHVDEFLVGTGAVSLCNLGLVRSEVAVTLGHCILITLASLSSRYQRRPLLAHSVQFVGVLTVLLQQLFDFRIGRV